MKKSLEHDPSVSRIPNDQELIGYLAKQLSSSDKRSLEEMITDDPLVGDAVEGLYQLNDKEDLFSIDYALKKMVDKQVTKNKKKRSMKPLGFPLWLLLLVTITLLSILGGYVLISLLEN